MIFDCLVYDRFIVIALLHAPGLAAGDGDAIPLFCKGLVYLKYVFAVYRHMVKVLRAVGGKDGPYRTRFHVVRQDHTVRVHIGHDISHRVFRQRPAVRHGVRRVRNLIHRYFVQRHAGYGIGQVPVGNGRPAGRRGV